MMSATTANDVLYNCSMCSFFCGGYDDFITHIIRRHQFDKKFRIHCSAFGCGASYSNVNSFKSHVARNHPENLQITSSDENQFAFSVTDVAEQTLPHCANEAAFILSLLARHRLSHTAVADICQSTRELFRAKMLTFSTAGEQVADTLFAELDTNAKQENFFKKHFRLVLPQKKKLGTSQYRVFKNNKCRVMEKEHYGYFVSLKHQLSALLGMPEIQQNLPRVQCTNYTNDFCDSSYILHHRLQRGPETLHLCLYTDDFEIVNAIGSHRKKHKLTAFYWTLLNTPTEYRSKLCTIQLAALARSSDLRQFGTDQLLNDFVSTLQQLQDGILLDTSEFGSKLYQGFLVCVLADTPAAQLLGGFKEGVGSAISPCRSCDVKHSEMADVFSRSQCNLRGLQEHEDRVAFLKSINKRGKLYWSKKWGVNGESVLCDVPGFDVTKCFLHDPMHIILEGIGKTEMKRLLIVLMYEKKYFTLDCLNQRIQHHAYSEVEKKDKPELIEKKSLERNAVLPQTAAAMKNLIVNFPFIIGDLIPYGDEHWQTFILLLQILLLSVTPVTSVNTADVLESLIALHNRRFVNLYGEDAITPKFHYLVHFPDQLRLFGALHNHMCLRFESKNGFFKMQRWFNFRNIPKSLSYFHQRWMCMQMTQTSGQRSETYLYSGDEVACGSTISVDSIPGFADFLHNEYLHDDIPSRVLCSPRVVINGIEYRRGAALLLKLEDDVEFVIVKMILVCDQKKYAHCFHVNVTSFDSHMNAFIVQPSEMLCTVNLAHLTYKWPQKVHNDFVMLYNVDDCWTL